MAERASRIVLVLRLKDSLFAPSSPPSLPWKRDERVEIRTLDYCLSAHTIRVQSKLFPPPFLSHFYFRKRFIFLSTFSLFPFFLSFFFSFPNSFHDRSLTKTLHENSVIQVRSTLATDSLSLSVSLYTLFLRPYPSLDGPWRGETHESRKNSTETPAVQFVRGSRFVIGFKSRTAVSICGWYQLL